MDKGKVLTGVLAGFAAGALLGVLLAPDKGSETRKKMAQKGSEALDDLKEKLDDIVDGFSEKFKAMKETVGEYCEMDNKPNEV
jgi:gas vesicle protein